MDDGFTLVESQDAKNDPNDKNITNKDKAAASETGDSDGKDLKKRGKDKDTSKTAGSGETEESKQDGTKDGKSASGAGLPIYLFKSAAVWAVIWSHVAHNYCRHTLSWLPTYFDEVLHIDATMVGSILFFPEVLGVGIRFLCPLMAKILADRGYTLAESRKLFTGAGCFGTCIGVAFFLNGSTPLGVERNIRNCSCEDLVFTRFQCFIEIVSIFRIKFKVSKSCKVSIFQQLSII